MIIDFVPKKDRTSLFLDGKLVGYIKQDQRNGFFRLVSTDQKFKPILLETTIGESLVMAKSEVYDLRQTLILP